MNVYQIALPNAHNASTINYAPERVLWERAALDLAGGYTALGARQGVWRNDAGKVYSETMHWYEVACTRECWKILVRSAFDLFPDQLAIYTAQVGTCEIIPRS